MVEAGNACPSARILERLLADELPGQERLTIETHVESCGCCQEQLEILVATTLQRNVPVGGMSHKPEPEPGEGFLSRLRELSPPGAGGPPRVPRSPPLAASSRPAVPDASWGGAAWLENGRLGQYKVLGKLGKGGMGAVFKARHTELGKIVALKVLPVERMDEISIARFRNEIRAIGKLDHPNIVVAHDAGESCGVHFLVMELLDGMDLARVIERHGRLPAPDACEAIRQAAVGLQHAYEQGLVHRDVKPSNLMLARDGRVRLLDLGLARSIGEATADRLTLQGALLGTADYLAPEQWDQPHAADTRADIYSLGCTLYHILAGQPPFANGPHQSLLGKMWAHREVPPPPIEQMCPGAPAGLVAVLERMLAKDPAARFATPAEVAAVLRPYSTGADLGRFVAGENVTSSSMAAGMATAATPAPGTWKTDPDRSGLQHRAPIPTRRRRLRVALASLGLALAVASVAWLLFLGLPGTDNKPLVITDMHVVHSSDRGKTLVGDLRNSSLAVRLNDSVQVKAKLTPPAYFYLIAFNPQGSEAGTEQLCQPEGEDGKGAGATSPNLRNEVLYPRDTHDFILDATGLQAFVLAASTKPLPPYAEWRSGAGKIPWEGIKDAGTKRWHFDGRTFTRFPRERGKVEPRADVPEALRKLRDFLLKRPEFEVVQIVAFPVGDDRK